MSGNGDQPDAAARDAAASEREKIEFEHEMKRRMGSGYLVSAAKQHEKGTALPECRCGYARYYSACQCGAGSDARHLFSDRPGVL